jgi:hypothetical protein
MSGSQILKTLLCANDVLRPLFPKEIPKEETQIPEHLLMVARTNQAIPNQ